MQPTVVIITFNFFFFLFLHMLWCTVHFILCGRVWGWTVVFVVARIFSLSFNEGLFVYKLRSDEGCVYWCVV